MCVAYICCSEPERWLGPPRRIQSPFVVGNCPMPPGYRFTVGFQRRTAVNKMPHSQTEKKCLIVLSDRLLDEVIRKLNRG
jgi:hypothetical protein